MKIILLIQPATDDGIPTGPRLQNGVSLPRGCGLDRATAEIDSALKSIRECALELFKAETEGREPKLP